MGEKINIGGGKYIIECEVCGTFTAQRYMTNDLAICHDCMDTPEFLEWLRVNRPIFYDFEITE